VIINETVVAWSATKKASLGMLKNGTTLVGYVLNRNDYRFQSMLEGNGWLIRDGKSYVAECEEFKNSPHGSFVMLKAPRTAAGVRSDGSLFIAVVDGVEETKEGPDLYEFAEILLEEGV
jgi:exopolysaccharide biosynthesis protein